MFKTMDIDFVTAMLDEYGLSDRLDAKQVLLKIGGRRPGKHCIGKGGGKGSYIAAEKKCAGHKTAFGELTEAGKTSARELADKVRKRKGMAAIEKAPPLVHRSLKMYERNFERLYQHNEELKAEHANRDRITTNLAKRASASGTKALAKVNAAIAKTERNIESAKIQIRQTDIGGKQVRITSSGKDPDGSTTATFSMAGEKRGSTVGATIRFHDGEVEHLPPATINGKIFNVDRAVSDHIKANAKESKDFADFVSRAVASHNSPVDPNLIEEIRTVPSLFNGVPYVSEFDLQRAAEVRAATAKTRRKNSTDRRDSQLERTDTMDFDFVTATLDKYGLSDRFDAKKVLLKMGGRRPGKRCKKGWIAAEKQCSDHKTADGKLTAAGKSSASELADKVRKRKGLESKTAIAGRKIGSAKDRDNTEYTRFAHSKNQSMSPNAGIKTSVRLAEIQKQSGKAYIWNKPFNEQSMQIFGYGDQSVHRKQVEKAIKRGETIPDNVLKQYPEFAGITKDKTSPKREITTKAIVKEMARYEADTLKKQLVGLDDRIESAQKAGTARKTAATKAKSAEKKARVLLGATVTKNPSGRFSFKGKVPVDLAFIDATPESIEKGKTAGARFGPKTRSFTSEKEAVEFAESLGYEFNQGKPSIKPKEITPAQLNSGDRKQAVAYNQQGAERAKSEGRSGDASAWDKQVKAARISDVRSSRRQKSTSQGEMFGIEETTDLPLFRKRKDSYRRFDRAIAGGKATPKSTRRKHNCTSKSQQCGTVCVSLKKECRDGAVSGAQDRLRKLKKSGADDLQVQRAKQSIKDRTVGKRNEINDKRIGSLRNRVKNATMSGVGKSEGLAELDPNSIEVDPKRFQYKIIGEHTSTGSVGSLSGVRKYDPNLAGILQVWKDPKDGKTYVVNGHNRLDLGKKLGAESVAVRYLKAPDAKTARSIGALTNIAEGRGDALDAAKFFRDTGISKEDLNAKGIPMREKIATEGLALSRLDDSLFRRTIDGDIPMARAAIVGGSGLDAAQQRDLMKLVDREGKKKNLTDGAIAEMVDIAKSSQTRQESTMSLFGEESVTKSNMIEKAKLQASIKQRLSREKNLFGTVSRGRAASELARGGNTIDRAKSGEISDQANQSLKSFDQMKNLSGPMSDAINRAASRMATGESQKSVEKDLYAEITSIDIFGGTKRRAA